MTIHRYDVGDVVRVTAAFTNSAGTATDPTTVALKYKDPAGVTTTKTYAAADITKDSTGNYHYDIPIDQPGIWFYRWESTGAAQAAGEASFEVRETEFD